MNPWDGLMTPVADRAGNACLPAPKPGARRTLPTTPATLIPAAAVVRDERSGALRLLPIIAADFYAEV